MSRSYKHSNLAKQKNSKDMKKFANKKVRNTKDIPSGGAYKKCFPTYDICDFKWFWNKQDAIHEWELAEAGLDYARLLKRFHNLNEYLAYWYKTTKRK